MAIIGSAAVDITAQAASQNGSDSSIGSHTTVPGAVSLTLGGVARNVAEAAHRILASQSEDGSSATVLISPIGRDSFGRLLQDETHRIGMRTDGLIQMDNARTAICNLVLDSVGGLTGGVADMDISRSLDRNTALEVLQRHKPDIVALDGNLSQETIKSLVQYCHERKATIFYEPTSVPKSTNILPAIAASLHSADNTSPPIAFAAPNILELAHMYQEAVSGPLELTSHRHWWGVIDDMALGSEFRMDLEQLARLNANEEDPSRGNMSFLIDSGIAQMAIHLLPFFQHLLIKCGDRGAVAIFRVSGEKAQRSAWTRERSNVRGRYVVGHSKNGPGATVVKHFPALSVPELVNVTGAGDSLVGAVLARLLREPDAFQDPSSLQDLMTFAQRAAVLTLQSHEAVSSALSSM